MPISGSVLGQVLLPDVLIDETNPQIFVFGEESTGRKLHTQWKYKRKTKQEASKSNQIMGTIRGVSSMLIAHIIGRPPAPYVSFSGNESKILFWWLSSPPSSSPSSYATRCDEGDRIMRAHGCIAKLLVNKSVIWSLCVGGLAKRNPIESNWLLFMKLSRIIMS